MKPTQIHLSERDVALLDAESARTGASRAELVRRAVREIYGGGDTAELPRSVGVVSDGSGSAETIDAELGAIFEERWKRWHA